ncbi:MAG TPA: metallopeptidase TldD-related protein [Thermoanaerobaculia bacterium]|nr:metallopeptidase TldD-related protein [Thermoanaerobaculia bacterium]
MAFPGFDCARVARALGLLCTEAEDLADAYFERIELTETPGAQAGPGLVVRREEGFALRLVRGGRVWLVSRDEIGDDVVARAFRQVARSLPPAAPSFRGIEPGPWPELEDADALLGLHGRVEHELRQLRAGFPFRLRARRHRREAVVVSPRLQPDPQVETFYSVEADVPWGRWGGLMSDLDEAPLRIASALAELFRARDASPPQPVRTVVVLGPAAAAVFLHEAAAHTLEADTLALTGRPSSAIGVRLGSEILDVLDDPARAPGGVRRTSDDEGMPVTRRWLLRAGVVEQPIADRTWADRAGLQPGAGRRSQRHRLPVPRSSHLELLPGTFSFDELQAGATGGLLVQEVDRGRLDPFSGRFVLDAASARRIGPGGLGERLRPVRLSGSVVELLSAINGIGSQVRSGGAGWCAKGGDRLPVWATAAALRLEGIQVGPP